MKHIFTTILAVLMLTVSNTLRAQDDVEATHIALTRLLQKHSVNADTIAKELSKKFSKDPAMQTAIARAYYRTFQNGTARHYLNKALKTDPKHSPAYILYGDMYCGWDVDSAAVWYSKAIEADSTFVDGYLRYATLVADKDMDKAKAKLEELRRVKPTFDVDASIAELYNLQGDDKAAAAAFANADANRLTMNQLAKYAQNLYWTQQDVKAMEIAQVGMARFPQNKGFDRLYFWCATRTGKYQEALKHGTVWMENTARDSINSIDLFSMGASHLGLGETEKAFGYFADIATMTDYFAPQMKGQITRMVNNVVEENKASGNYAKATEVYSRYMEAYPAEDRALQMYQLASIYRDEQESLEGEQKKEVIKVMFEIYDNIEKLYPDWENIHYVLYTHARWTYAYFDPQNEQSLAEPYYRKLYDVLAREAAPSEQKKAMLVEACKYLASDCYFQKEDTPSARMWWTRILKYDPDDETAKEALDKIRK